MSRDAKNLPTIPPPSLRLPLPRQGVLIEHRVNGSVITQNPTNGYINATTLCKKAGKMFGHYFANASTKEFLEELSTDIGIPIAVDFYCSIFVLPFLGRGFCPAHAGKN